MPVERASHAQQIANELRAAIEAGTYKPGDRLPSDGKLADEFGVSKPTITKARSMLVALRLVDSRAGAPSVVRDVSREGVPAGNRIQLARRTGRVYPEGHYADVLRAELAPASAETAEGLNVAVGAMTIERHRLTCAADGTPLARSVSFFPGDLAESCPALLDTQRIPEGTTLYIEERSGRTAASVASTVWCQAPGPGIATSGAVEQLGLDAGAYVLVISTTTYDDHGEPMAYEVELHPPDTRLALDVVGV